MEPCNEGEPGYFVTRGNNLMSGYVNDSDATTRVFAGDWYTGLSDVGFYLINTRDGERDYYWMSRESDLMIRGGANYAYEQINRELREAIGRIPGLTGKSVDLAVVGLKVDSEHEDACCVTVTLLDGDAWREKAHIEWALREVESKASKPDYIRFAKVPRNFKGTILVPELKRSFASWLKENRTARG